MHTLEAVGACTVGGGFAGAVITGFLDYLAGHGVDLAPNPTRAGDPRDTPEQRAFFATYNARYADVARVAFRVCVAAALAGLILVIVGAVG